VSLSCEETVKLIRSYGSILSLTVVTAQKSVIDAESSTANQMHTCEISCIAVYVFATDRCLGIIFSSRPSVHTSVCQTVRLSVHLCIS